MIGLGDIASHPSRLVATLGLAIATSAITLVGASAFVARLPADYFVSERRPSLFPERPAWQRWAFRVAKNVVALLLVAIGTVLALPGVPGQGVLTILVGLILLDFPGKHAFERKIASRARVLSTMNRLRSRLGKEPLLPPAPEEKP